MNRVGRLTHIAATAALAFELSSVSALMPHAAYAAPPAGGADATQTAEQLANIAYEQHAAGKYAESIATYLKAYEISRTGAILLNVATIYDRKMHERSLASEYYRRYLLAPDADPDHVKKANERLTALKKEIEAEDAARNSAPMPAQVSDSQAQPNGAQGNGDKPANGSDGKALRTAGIVLTVTGVLSLGASAVLGLVAKGKNDDANGLCDGTTCRDPRGVTLAKDAGTFATGSTIAFIAGVALVGGGITMYFVAPKNGSSATAAKDPHVTIAPAVGLNQAGFNVAGSF